MYTEKELIAAKQAIDSMCRKCETIEPKLKVGSAQQSLLRHRIQALRIASDLIQQQLTLDMSTVTLNQKERT